MLITTYKTNNLQRYMVCNLKRKYVNRYNKYIARNSEILITNKADIDFEKIISK